MALMEEGPTLYPVLSLCTTFSGRTSSHEFSICPDSLCSSLIHTPSIVTTFQRGQSQLCWDKQTETPQGRNFPLNFVQKSWDQRNTKPYHTCWILHSQNCVIAETVEESHTKKVTFRVTEKKQAQTCMLWAASQSQAGSSWTNSKKVSLIFSCLLYVHTAQPLPSPQRSIKAQCYSTETRSVDKISKFSTV